MKQSSVNNPALNETQNSSVLNSDSNRRFNLEQSTQLQNFYNFTNGTFTDEPFIIHPGAISSILHLLPQIASDQNDHVNKLLINFLLEIRLNKQWYKKKDGKSFAVSHGEPNQEPAEIRTQPADHV